MPRFKYRDFKAVDTTSSQKRRRNIRRLVLQKLQEQYGHTWNKLYPGPWKWVGGELQDRNGVRLASEQGGYAPAQPYQPPQVQRSRQSAYFETCG